MNCKHALMDIGLPDFDGIEATRQIRALDNPQRTKVSIVALTGHASEWENKGKTLATGMQDVLAKPLSTPELESLMQQYVFNPEEKLVSLKEAETTKAEAQGIAPVIDWPQSLEQYNGDEEIVRELLSALATDLNRLGCAKSLFKSRFNPIFSITRIDRTLAGTVKETISLRSHFLNP
jgi:CheY-like chemotaxis protein